MRALLLACLVAAAWSSKIAKEEQVQLGMVARTFVHDPEQVGCRPSRDRFWNGRET